MSDHPSIVECLSTAMEAIRAVGKTGKNTQQNYNFRGIDAVVNAASPAFRQVGVVVTPELRSIDYETVEVGNKRSLMQSCKVVVAYTFHGPAGDTVTAVAPGEAMDSGDKATAKAMSVAFRTALLQALCIPTTDSDPDEHTYERSPRQEQTQEAGTDIAAAAAKRGIVERLTGQVDDPTGHAAEVWRGMFGDSNKPITTQQWDALCDAADAHVADLREMASKFSDDGQPDENGVLA